MDSENCVIKTIVKKEESGAERSTTAVTVASSPPPPIEPVLVPKREREPSPELARISALFIRPPKNKMSSKPTTTASAGGGNGLDIEPTTTETSAGATLSTGAEPTAETSPLPTYWPEESLSFPSTSPQSSLPKIKTGGLKLKAKDLGKKPQMEPVEPIKLAYYYDKEGNKVWICPACGGQDDGSPMIGCDGCDAWYHWVCVGIQVPPDETEDWYCRICIKQKQENLQDKKKKSRKKKC